ncbi:hypothetical protein DHEL01_v201145 [Diaporthe helianthi]|uniref:Uncharacterized protein n=1 Tax=Diaporthe helianthi TaxID=158607 RepID=A0A2P5ID81_DIAHE|nr:hypothetical protein DHEL01_v201145 [Diaporthe helianthi]
MADPSAHSPTPSTCSGTTTVPNTPRPKHDSDHDHEHGSNGGRSNPSSPQSGRDKSVSRQDSTDPFGDEDAVDAESSTSSAASRRRLHNIQPTCFQKVETLTPALATWQSTHRLDNISLHLNWAPHDTSGSAFFKIQTALQFEDGLTARRDGRVSVFIFIYPERIDHLAFDLEPVEKPLGPDTVALAFEMNRAPALVVPHTYKCVGTSAEATMNSLRELATQLSFTVYTSLPRRKLSESRLRQLCTAVTDQKLSSIQACANTLRLYGGQGAQLLEGDELSKPTLNPPAYDDVGLHRSSLNTTTTASKSQKRRRRSSSESASEHRSKIPTDIKAWLDDRLDAHKQEVIELLGRHRSQILHVLQDFKAELDDKLDAREEKLVEDRLSDLVAAKVEEQMGEVEERVMESITSRPLQASLTFPDHCLY